MHSSALVDMQTYPCGAGHKVTSSVLAEVERRIADCFGERHTLLWYPLFILRLNKSNPTTRRGDSQLLSLLCLITMHELSFLNCFLDAFFLIKTAKVNQSFVHPLRSHRM